MKKRNDDGMTVADRPKQHVDVLAENRYAVGSKDPFTVIHQIRTGLSISYLDMLSRRLNITNEMLASLLGVSAVSLSRWAKSNKVLDSAVSEAAIRMNEIVELAEAVLESPDAAIQWLKTPNLALGKRPPIEWFDTESGRQLIKQQLLKIEYSVGF